MKWIIVTTLALMGASAFAVDQEIYTCSGNQLTNTVTLTHDLYVDYFDMQTSKGSSFRGAASRFENADAVMFMLPLLGNNREVLRIDKKTNAASLVTSGLTCTK